MNIKHNPVEFTITISQFSKASVGDQETTTQKRYEMLKNIYN